MTRALIPRVLIPCVLALVPLVGCEAQETAPSPGQVPDLVQAFARGEEGAAERLLAAGPAAYAPLEAAAAASEDAAFQERAEALLERIGWGAGHAALERLRAAQEAEGGANRAGPPALEAVDTPALRRFYPRQRFFRLVRRSEYYKPGQRWHGTVYAVERFAAEPRKVYQVGEALSAGWNGLLALQCAVALEDEGTARAFLAAAMDLLQMPVMPEDEADLALERTERGWRVTPRQHPDFAWELVLDAEGRPARREG